MKSINFILGLLAVICISVIHIHFSLYTIDNVANPVTLVALFMKGEDIYMLFIGYSVQFLVTLLAAYFILKARHLKVWIIVYIIGAFAAHWIDKYSHLSSLPLGDCNVALAYYYKFYGYGDALILGVYYVVLQLFVLVLYMLFVVFLGIPVIKRIHNRITDFIYNQYDAFMHSEIYEGMCRNRYVWGTVILIIILFCMIIGILSRYMS